MTAIPSDVERRPESAAAETPAWPSTWNGEARPRMGFFTDTSLCIGCKACEVACKTWNEVPEDGLRYSGESYDNTGGLGADTWRHVAFVEQRVSVGGVAEGMPDSLAAEAARRELADGAGLADRAEGDGLRWLMASDVCKHCTHAACLEVCPTGSIFRTEFGTVVVQPDICNGCGYCISSCPFGVLDRREKDGRAWKCTLCYDRLKADLQPACAQACPTKSIQFGEHADLVHHARERVEALQARGMADARLYGADTDDGVGGFGAFFLLLDEPEVYGLPPDPVDPTRHLGQMWKAAAGAAGALALGVAAAFAGGRR